jgi:Zn-dependent M28 family amino/carboxypeptidase
VAVASVLKGTLLAALVLIAQTLVTPQLRDTTASIAQSATTLERGSAIVDRLKASTVQFELQNFTVRTRKGANIVATLPGKLGKPSLLLGAHYDRVDQGQGAVDNAAACAVLLDLLDRLKAKPLNRTVRAVFFDLEEANLLGSRAYFEMLVASDLPEQAINLDVFAYGDTLFATASREDGPLLASLRQAASEAGLQIRSVPLSQYPSSDHQNMVQAGVETLGLALIDGTEIDSIVGRGGGPPRILTIIHTPRDTIDQIREQDMARAVPVLERTIRLLDAVPAFF